MGILFAVTTLAALTLACAANAQPGTRFYRIGVLHVGDHQPPGLQPLRDGLRTLGYEEGRTLSLDFRNLADEAAAGRTARDFAQGRVDLIVAFGDPTVRAARAATSTIPIVMIHATDPVARGFVKSLARPGGNITGFVYFAVSPAKQVELFKEIVPGLRRLLVLVDPGDPATARDLAEIRKAAVVLRLQLVEREAGEEADVRRVFASLRSGDVDGVVAASNSLHIRFTRILVRLTADHGLPLASYRREAVEEGAPFSYAPDVAAVGGPAATLVDKILKGARPADIPVQQPTTFEFVLNAGRARALGLALPASVASRADRLVE